MSDAGELHRTQETFGKGPIGLLLDKTVSDGAVRQYSYMHWRYGSNHQNFEGRESIAEAMGVSETTVTNRTRQLENIDWIVVIRQYDDRTKKTRNFYHVFETQEDCRLWRIEHKFVKPSYDGDPRKLRTGKGGKPSHKVDEDSNPNSGLDRGNVNSGLDRDVNSSSHYLDSVDPDSNTSDAPNGGQLDDKPKRVSKPRPRDLIIDTLAVNVLGQKPGVSLAQKSGLWLGGIKKEIFEQYPDMTGELLSTIFEWKKPYTPKNVAKIIGMIGEYINVHAAPDEIPNIVPPSPADDIWGDPLANVTAPPGVAV